MRIAVAGTGKVYFREKDFLVKKFDIVAIADNAKAGQYIDGYKCVLIDELQRIDCDKILICTSAYMTELKSQLNKIGIENDKILSISDILDEIHKEDDMDKYNADKAEYKRQCIEKGESLFLFHSRYEKPEIKDYRQQSGDMDNHYYYMDILIAKKIIHDCPRHHYDIGSRIDGLISHLITADIMTTAIDIRPLSVRNPGAGIVPLEVIQADAVTLQEIPDNSIASLSSLHAVEHFGLGRYGDEIDTDACFKAMKTMQRVLACGGKLYFAVPVGKENRLYFNAHRVFQPETIIECFNQLKTEEMFLIHNNMILTYTSVDVTAKSYQQELGEYDCGIFIFSKSQECVHGD